MNSQEHKDRMALKKTRRAERSTRALNQPNFPKLLSEGWVERRLPWMKTEFWKELLTIIGADNVIVLEEKFTALASQASGVLLISPAGQLNLARENDKKVVSDQDDPVVARAIA